MYVGTKLGQITGGARGPAVIPKKPRSPKPATPAPTLTTPAPGPTSPFIQPKPPAPTPVAIAVPKPPAPTPVAIPRPYGIGRETAQFILMQSLRARGLSPPPPAPTPVAIAVPQAAGVRMAPAAPRVREVVAPPVLRAVVAPSPSFLPVARGAGIPPALPGARETVMVLPRRPSAIAEEAARRFALSRAFRLLPDIEQQRILSAMVNAIVPFARPPEAVPEVPFERRSTPPQVLRGIEDDMSELAPAVPAFIPPRKYRADGRLGSGLGQGEDAAFLFTDASWADVSPSQVWDEFARYWRKLKGMVNDLWALGPNLDDLIHRLRSLQGQAEQTGLFDEASRAARALAEAIDIRGKWGTIENKLRQWLPTWEDAAQTASLADLTDIGAIPILPIAAVAALAVVVVYGGGYLTDYLRLRATMEQIENKVLTPEQAIQVVRETREPGIFETVKSGFMSLENPMVIAGIVGVSLLLMLSRR